MGTENPNVLDEMISDRLKGLGFDPGVVVYIIRECGLTMDELKAGLFEHSWDAPNIVVIHEADCGQEIPMIVTSIRAVWNRHQPSTLDGVTPAGIDGDPDWYITGRPLRTYFGAGGPVEVHAYFEGPDPEGKLSHVYVQEVYEPTGADPSTPLKYTSEY